MQHHRNIGVAAQRAFFHVAIADAQVFDQLLDFDEVGIGFLAGADVGLRHNLNQRHAGAVQVHQGFGFAGQMHRFARVLLHVNARDADALRGAVGEAHIHVAVVANRGFVLRNLVAFGQVGVKVVFAGKQVVAPNLAVGGQAHFHGKLHGCAVHLGQGAGVAEGNHRQVGVGGHAVLVLISRIHLAVREQLGVYFQADNGLVFGKGGFVHNG